MCYHINYVIYVKLCYHIKSLSLGRMMDLKFKGSTTIRIINIYVQCNEKDKDKKEKLLNELLKLIKEVDQRKFHLVIMEDFNADMERYIAKNKLAIRGKYRILQMLLDKGLHKSYVY